MAFGKKVRVKLKPKPKKKPKPKITNPLTKYSVYKSKKGILNKKIIKNNYLIKIRESVIRVHHIIVTTMQFIKAYCLYQIKNNKPIPEINIDFVDMCIKAVTIKDTRGPSFKGTNKDLLETLQDYYVNEFEGTLRESKISTTKLNQTLKYARDQIITAYENNINMHFISRLFRYVNCVFGEKNKDELSELKGKELTERKHELRREYMIVKNDILNGTNKAPEIYTKWIKINRPLLIPTNYEESIPYDLKVDPQKYIKYMIYMNNELEIIGRKQFHCFPLRTDLVPKFIRLDTASLLELMYDTDTKKMRDNLKAYKKEIWNKIFKMSNKMFKYGKKDNLEDNENIYVFDYAIMTDGISIVSLFVRRDQFEKIFKLNPKPIKNKKEFLYIDEIPEEIDTLKKKYNIIYVDPGKDNIIYCLNDSDQDLNNSNIFFRYTRTQRLNETGRLHNQELIKKFKKDRDLNKIEKEISEQNSKTINYTKFMEYLKVKNKANSKLFIEYEEEFFRKMKLRTYICTKRSESKLVRNIKNIYGQNNNKEILMIYGDCNIGKQLRGIISTPMIGIKRMLSRNFRLLNIDEFRTSCLDYRTEERVQNACVKKGNKKKAIHRVLVSKIREGLNGKPIYSYQNRDKNAVRNMRKIFNYYLKYKERPNRYDRSLKIDNNIDKYMPIKIGIYTGSK